MRRFLLRTLAFVFPVLGVVIAVNYWMDPAHIFSDGGLEKQAVVIVLRGENVVGLSNYDERLFQKELIVGLKRTPGTVVLGSSRGMLIDSRNGNDTSLVNSCVSGARLEDMIALYQRYVDCNRQPHRVIVELSPYMFNGSYQDMRYRTLEEEYRKGVVAAGLKRSMGVNVGGYECLEAISLSYFQSAVRAWRMDAEVDAIAATADSVDKFRMIRFSDGSIAYSEDYRRKRVTNSELQAAVDYGNSENFTAISNERREMLEAFVAYLQGTGVVLEFFLAPLPDAVTGRIPVFAAVEAFVRSYASDRGIRVLGSYDSRRYSLSVADFYDGMHPRKEVYDLIMN